MQKYHIGAEPQRIDPDLISKFAEIEVATIGHFRHRGFVSHRLRPIAPIGGTIVGTAITVAIPGYGFDPVASCPFGDKAGRRTGH